MGQALSEARQGQAQGRAGAGGAPRPPAAAARWRSAARVLLADGRELRPAPPNERAEGQGGGASHGPIKEAAGAHRVGPRPCSSRSSVLCPNGSTTLTRPRGLAAGSQAALSAPVSPIATRRCVTGTPLSQSLSHRPSYPLSLAKWRLRHPLRPRRLPSPPRLPARRRRPPQPPQPRPPPPRLPPPPPPPRPRPQPQPQPQRRRPSPSPPRRCPQRCRARSPAGAWCGCTRWCSPPSWTASSGATRARRGSSARCWVSAAGTGRGGAGRDGARGAAADPLSPANGALSPQAPWTSTRWR